MKQKILAVCDTEESYAYKLTEYLIEKVRIPYAVHLFTEADRLREFIAKTKVEILLIAESVLKRFEEEAVRQQTAQIIVLSESGVFPGNDMPCIDKFQSPDKILEALTETIADLTDWTLEETAGGMEAKLIGVYSPVKRCLQTTFALTLGQLMARERKTLYINFENYSGFGQMLKRTFAMDMADLMYYYRSAREKLPLRLSAIIQNINGLDYIPPLQSGAQVREADGDQWLELCRYVAGIGQYEYIILDLDDGMEGLFDLLGSCYRIYTITKEDRFAAAKLNQYEQILRFNELEEIAGKTVKCRFPVFKEIPADLEMMTHGEMAGYVKAIIKEDLYGG